MAEKPTSEAAARPADPVDAALLELSGLVGLAAVKKEVADLGVYIKVTRERASENLESVEMTRHIIMTGNQGTGKTTVARLLGEIYHGYGLLQRPAMHVVDARDLVGEYFGQGAVKVATIFQEAMGGVLFIDDAYRLADRERDNFGGEALDALEALMEDHRDDVMVILAGYPGPMREFLHVNPGLKGRFGLTIHFPDYSNAELLELLERVCAEQTFDLTKEAKTKFDVSVSSARPLLGDRFDNARFVRRLFYSAVRRHHERVGDMTRAEKRKATEAELRELLDVDIPTAKELVPDADTEVG
jgi:AAA+ superfamily predicted ATPase